MYRQCDFDTSSKQSWKRNDSRTLSEFASVEWELDGEVNALPAQLMMYQRAVGEVIEVPEEE